MQVQPIGDVSVWLSQGILRRYKHEDPRAATARRSDRPAVAQPSPEA